MQRAPPLPPRLRTRTVPEGLELPPRIHVTWFGSTAEIDTSAGASPGSPSRRRTARSSKVETVEEPELGRKRDRRVNGRDREPEEAVRESTIPFPLEPRAWAMPQDRFRLEIEREYVVLERVA